MKTAFFIDAGFFTRRLRNLRGELTAEEAVRVLADMCVKHMEQFRRSEMHIYRVLVYDCPPLANRMHNPVSKTAINWANTSMFRWQTAFHHALRRERKVALRLGTLKAPDGWALRPKRLEEVIKGKKKFEDLTDGDFVPDVRQKGVDMRVGLDIASIASKRLVDQMVLVAGDSDFVPAAKTARREGVDFVLDPMGAKVTDDLLEHVDGVQTVLERDLNAKRSTEEPDA